MNRAKHVSRLYAVAQGRPVAMPTRRTAWATSRPVRRVLKELEPTPRRRWWRAIARKRDLVTPDRGRPRRTLFRRRST